MPIDFRNVNTLWTSILSETLHQLGLKTAVLCPGSRSAPLTIAFAQHPHIQAIPILDERSASFFALGHARQTQRPVVLVCTSGSAGANFFPAAIEARESRIPLLILTSDRPPELRDCNAGQTIDQQKLYGHFPNWYSELAIPEASLPQLSYLRQTVIQAWERSRYPVPGLVHLNLPYRDPLAPLPQPEAAALRDRVPADFFASIPALPPCLSIGHAPALSLPSGKGLILAGVAHPADPSGYCQAIAQLAQQLQVPVLAEGLSPVRNHAALNPHLITAYSRILRQPHLRDRLTPDWVIRIGEMPTDKQLRQWLTQTQPQQWVIDPGDRNLDPLHLRTVHWRCPIEALTVNAADPNPDLKQWLHLEAIARQQLQQAMAIDPVPENPLENTLFEAKAAWLLSRHLPAQTPVFIANSMPVRDVEWFWQANDRQYSIHCNRGANGIDGTLSSAIGMAHQQLPSVLLTGDLALLHDSNGGLIRPKFQGHLTIVLLNNNGGGIFENLPIAQFDPPFEEFFATPQAIQFAHWAKTYGFTYERIEQWDRLVELINPLPQSGIRLLEICSDRKRDPARRRAMLDRPLSE